MTTVTVSDSPTLSSGGPVGLICNDDHHTFGPVADRLQSLGYDAEFFDPGVDLLPPELDRLALLVNGETDPASFRALQYAESHGVPTWNGTTAFLLDVGLVGKNALEAAGFRVPPTHFERPAGPYIAKELFDWHTDTAPVVDGEGDFYEPLLDAEPFDFEYYVVDDGFTRHVQSVLSRSTLHGEYVCLGPVEPDPELVPKLERLLTLTGARALGVDVVIADGESYAVDVSPTPSFREAELVDVLVDSIVDCLQTAPPRLRVER
jgi:hypothetical protein